MNAVEKSRNRKNSYKLLISAIMVILASCITVLYSGYMGGLDDNMSFWAKGILFGLKYVPIILVTALGGAVPGMLSVLIVFALRSISYSSFSYLTFIYLLVACVVDALSKRKWFSSLRKVILSVVFLQFLLGDVWGLLLLLLDGNGFEIVTLRQFVMLFLNELPGCFISCFLTYFILNKLPNEKKLLLGNGKYYVSEEILDEEERYLVQGRSKIGLVVMNVIVIEAIALGIAAEVASNTLIPNIKLDSAMSPATDAATLAAANTADAIERLVSTSILESSRLDSDNLFYVLLGRGGYVNIQFSVKLAMLISIIVIPLAVFMNRYAQKRIAEPIRKLSKAVSNIYTSNDININDSINLVHSLDIHTKDEIEELYHSVDLTFYRLVEYIELVKNRQMIEDQLEVEKSANEAKSRFLSNISHEIRTPINAVLGFDEMILRECSDESILGYANDIRNSGKTLLALINDILDFSKIEAGKLELIPVEYELSSLLYDLVSMAQVKAKEKQLQFRVEINENTPHILFGDEIRIKQCIINLLTNAVKYTADGCVTLSIDYRDIEPEDPEVDEDDRIALCVSVSDTGIGIKEEDIDRLTVAFERIDEKKNRTIEGTGLGINIVNLLLGLMDSKLIVKSEYGVGSEFSFEIVQNVVSREGVGDIKGRLQSARTGSDYRESFVAPDACILVVDDTRTNLTVMAGLLKKTKIQVDTATSGMEALNMIREKKYNIIFLDHRMPEMDGIQTFHAMEEMEDNINSDTPVIALTANAISGSREMYFREGFANYMSKPVEPQKLEEMILSYLPEDIVEVVRTQSDDQEKEEETKESEAMQQLLRLTGIDVSEAVGKCGSAVVARDVMKDFRLSVEEKSGQIEKYLAEGNIRNYTIMVHGLKSSAKAIGAIDLSERAKYLEECGNEGRHDEILALTPELLALYRSYIDRLEPLADDDDSGKTTITAEELRSAYASIKEFVSASYFDSADDIMKMLESYAIPANEKEKYNELKRLMAAVDRDGILKIL